MTRVAHLDPEFIEMGSQTAGAWDQAGILVGRSGDQLRDEADAIREWDEVEWELTVLLKDLRRQSEAEASPRRGHPEALPHPWLHGQTQRPSSSAVLDDMKRAYLRRRKKAGKAAAEVEPEAPKD